LLITYLFEAKIVRIENTYKNKTKKDNKEKVFNFLLIT